MCIRDSVLGAFGPRGQVLLLIWRELIDLDAHGVKFEFGDMTVDIFGDGINLMLQGAGVLDQVFGSCLLYTSRCV